MAYYGKCYKTYRNGFGQYPLGKSGYDSGRMEEGRNQRLYINTLASSPKCEDYASVISGYLGKNWGFFLGIIYFIMIIMGVMMYSTAITNDSASFLYSFGVTDTILSENPLYGLVIIVLLVAVASRGEQILCERTPAYRGGSFLLQREQRH